MKYKAIFIDVDDTLVVHGLGNLPSEHVTRSINAVKDSVHVCLATGRILSGLGDIISHLQMTGLCVISNGIQIYDPQKSSVVWEKKINKESLPKVYRMMKKYKLAVRQFNGTDEYEFDGNMNRNDIYSLWADNLTSEKADEIIKDLGVIPGINAHKMTAWRKDQFAIEVTDHEVSKLHGILQACRILDIKPAEVIGVGDGYNDYPLLMACGLKIAMGNAVPELKAIADFVAPTVEEDGVATVIEKFILHE